MVPFVGDNAELQGSHPLQDILQSLQFGLVGLGHDDLNLLRAELANGHFLLAARIDAPADRSDEFVHIDILVGLLLLIDLVDENHTTPQVDTTLRGQPRTVMTSPRPIVNMIRLIFHP